MTLTLDQARAEFIAAGIPTVDLNGRGPGFLGLCPVCPGEITVTADDTGAVIHKCANGCDLEAIGHKLHFMRQRAEAKVPGASPTREVAPGTLRRCDISTMLTSDPEPVDWLVHGVVARGTLTLFVGREKEGKSLLGLGGSPRAWRPAAASWPTSRASPAGC